MSSRARRHRLRVARAVLTSRGDVSVLVRMAGWMPLLPLLKFVLPLPRLVRLMAAPPEREARDVEAERRIARMAHLLYRSRGISMRDNCLERSLLAYRYLGRANARPELVVGMRKREDGFLGHVWVNVDGHPVHDTPEELEEMVPMTSFDAGGRKTEFG